MIFGQIKFFAQTALHVILVTGAAFVAIYHNCDVSYAQGFNQMTCLTDPSSSQEKKVEWQARDDAI